MKWKNISQHYVHLREHFREATPEELLGINSNTTLDDIKKAYRKKISLAHPDKSSKFMASSDEEMAKLINSAYNQLTKGRTHE